MPRPPYSSGTIAPRKPMSAIFLTSSVSKCSLRSLSRTRGKISLSAKSRAVSRMSRCSSVSSNSITQGILPERVHWSVAARDPVPDGTDLVAQPLAGPALDDVLGVDLEHRRRRRGLGEMVHLLVGEREHDRAFIDVRHTLGVDEP